MEITLLRKYFPDGVNGELFLNNKKIGNTIELPWLNNLQERSCISEGRYPLGIRNTSKFGWHFTIDNVPGRSHVLMHSFNDALKESRGCIAPVTTITGHGQGTFSRNALIKLVSMLEPVFAKNEPVYLTIKKSE